MDTLRLPNSTFHQRHSFDSTTQSFGTLNVAIFGSSGVGKTTLINQFITGRLVQNYKPTIEDCHNVSFKVGENDCRNVQFIDTAGLYEFPAMRRFNVTSADAFILVFTPSQSDTLHYCFNIIQEVYEFRGADEVQIALIGNQRLNDESELKVRNPSANVKEAYKLSANLVYYYISALDKLAVDRLFNDLISSIIFTKMNKTKRESYQWFPYLRKRSTQSTICSNNSMSPKSVQRKRSTQSALSCTGISQRNEKTIADSSCKKNVKVRRRECALM